jgi:methylthioribulose-1-phosphate dehydratase
MIRGFYVRGWAPATAGNYSYRRDNGTIRISRSGINKAAFSASDFITVDASGNVVEPGTPQPSAETLLHTAIYRLFDAQFVLHVHSVANTTLSRHYREKIEFSGFELQKVFPGQTTHAALLSLPIFANSQDMPALAREVETRFRTAPPDLPGFLLAGHGLYAWGRTLEETVRHLEALEFLLACKLEMKKAGIE